MQDFIRLSSKFNVIENKKILFEDQLNQEVWEYINKVNPNRDPVISILSERIGLDWVFIYKCGDISIYKRQN